MTTVTRCARVDCNGMSWRDVRLAYVHEYSQPDLDEAIRSIGYEIVTKFERGIRSVEHGRVVLLYLFQKP
ncbi:MAG: hypothetical protein ACRD12_15895 [Acidimicrobiales bacterium]